LAITLALFVGCKATEISESGFLGEEVRMKHDDRAPFHRFWFAPFHRFWFDEQLDWDSFTEIRVADINTDYLQQPSWGDQTTLGAINQEGGIENVSAYMHNSLTEAFMNDPNRKLAVVERAGPKTLVLEVALIEIVPTKAWLNAIGVGTIGVGGLDKGSIAIEARMKDAGTNKVVARFADREQGKFAIVSIADLTWYWHAENSIDDWSEQIVEVMSTPNDGRVEDSLPVTLRPW
jgi:hypothetical protein